MQRATATLAALALATACPAATAQDFQAHGWDYYYDDDIEGCVMSKSFGLSGGGTSAFEVEISFWEEALLILRNSNWTMPETETTAEIWFSYDFDRPADATVSARYHKVDGVTHLDVDIGDGRVERISESQWVVVRARGGEVFERYDIGNTEAALSELYACVI